MTKLTVAFRNFANAPKNSLRTSQKALRLYYEKAADKAEQETVGNTQARCVLLQQVGCFVQLPL
jgi:hypothetical protein